MVEGPSRCGELIRGVSDSVYFTISEMLPGREERVIMVVTPAEVASRAATILVDMPPVPRGEPEVETSTARVEMSDTTGRGLASGFERGFLS